MGLPEETREEEKDLRKREGDGWRGDPELVGVACLEGTGIGVRGGCCGGRKGGEGAEVGQSSGSGG